MVFGRAMVLSVIWGMRQTKQVKLHGGGERLVYRGNSDKVDIYIGYAG